MIATVRDLSRTLDQEGGAEALAVLVAVFSELADAHDDRIEEELESMLADISDRLTRPLVTRDDYALLPLKDEVLLAPAKREIRRFGRTTTVERLRQRLTFDGAREHLAAFVAER